LIKADINLSNVMLMVADESILESVESAEAENRLLKKVVNNICTIHSSHSLGLPKDALWGEPVLCDFGKPV
jgi:serine/threonine-protein kinase SRPK3